MFLGLRVPTSTVTLYVTRHREGGDLFGLHRRRAAIPTIVVAEGSVVDGITVIVSHEGLTAFDTVDQRRVRVPLETGRADDSLHSCGVQPVGDVTYGHVHWQDDGLAVVVQARGGTFRPYGVAFGALQLEVAVELARGRALALHLLADVEGPVPGAVLPAVDDIAPGTLGGIAVFTLDPTLAVELEAVGALVEPVEFGGGRVTCHGNASSLLPAAILGTLGLEGSFL